MKEIDRSWMTDGTPVFYDIKYPETATYEGVLDGVPWDCSFIKNVRHWVVRIKDMDVTYRKKYGVKVVSVADIANIRPKGVFNE